MVSRPKQPSKPRVSVSPYDELYPMKPMDPNERSDPVEWLASGLVMRNKINLMFGPEKAGKSRVLAYLLVHMFLGRELWNKPVNKPERVLYLCGEETRQDVTRRIMEYCEHLDVASLPWPELVSFMEASGMRLDRNDQRNWLRATLVREGFDMLVIDPLRRVHGAKESSNDEMSRILNDFREWSNSLPLTMLILHHTGKLGPDDDEDRIATWSRGASDLPAILDWATYVTRTPRTTGDLVHIRRRGRAANEPDIVLVDEDDPIGFNFVRYG